MVVVVRGGGICWRWYRVVVCGYGCTWWWCVLILCGGGGNWWWFAVVAVAMGVDVVYVLVERSGGTW